MTEEARWQRELIVALHLEQLFSSAQWGFADSALGRDLQPTRADSERAVANIQSWRRYLPEACVQKMIEDGWQWST